ncbi:hypothetical protein F5Y13DRAFT_205668 [Hypoxylon sp. FL1857]|nr:hypothetical protein F5Y13DRAFT_205668 [Hypoxylon sp. FL1857]
MDDGNTQGQANMATPDVNRCIAPPPGFEHLFPKEAAMAAKKNNHDQANDQVNDKANNQANGQANGQTNDHTTSQASDQASTQENNQENSQESDQESDQANSQARHQARIPSICTNARHSPDQDNLFTIVARHEGMIRKRWSQKSKPKRKALLLQAWPDMSVMHRPDVEVWRSESLNLAQVEEEELDKLLEPFLWPHLNLEDMCKTEPLLLMLNSRARYTPDTFTITDLRSINFGNQASFIRPSYLPDYCMVFRGRDSPETYGQLYSTKDDGEICLEPARFWYTPGDGLCILHVQSRIYEFLVECCMLILHDIPQETLLPAPDVDVDFEIEPLDIPAMANSGDVRILSTTAFEDYYKGPEEADFSRIVTLVKAILSYAEDHLLAMREDPSYFVASMKDRYEHIYARLLDTNDEPHFTSLLPHPYAFSAEMVRTQITEAMDNVSRLHEIIDPQSADLSPERELLPKQTEVLFDTYYIIARSIRELLGGGRLELAFYSSLPIRAHFRRPAPGYQIRNPVNSRLQIPVMSWWDNSTLPRAHHSLMFFVSMLADADMIYVVGGRDLALEVDLLIKRDPDQISTIGVLVECLHQIDLFRPWLAGFEAHLNQHRAQSCLQIMDVRESYWSSMCRLLDHFNDEAFEYPAQKPPCREVIESMQKSENALDLFWEAAVLGLKSAEAFSPRVRSLFSLKVQRTAEWIAPPETSQKTNGKKKKKKKEEKLEDAFDKLMIETRKQNEAIKKELEENSSETFRVDKRAFKVFNVLLFEGPDASRLGEVSWNDFVYAMKQAGFKVTKLFGFAWLFDISDGSEFTDAMIFMEPHETGKLSFLMAKDYGRRLRRAYDWKIDRFILVS